MSASYLFEILFYDGDTVLVYSQAPVKSSVTFNNGGYRDLNGAGLTTIGNTDPLLVSTDLTGTQVVATNAANLFTAPDDEAHVPYRTRIDTFDCWVFTNAAGDVVASPKCNDVQCFAPYTPKPGRNIDVTPVTPDDANPLGQPFKHLYVVGAGAVVLVYEDGTSDTVDCAANTVRLIGPFIQVKATGTTATGILAW